MSYLGIPPFGRTARTVTEVIATSGQTTFYPNGGYTVGYLDVTLNGITLLGTDFTATDGLSVVLNSAAVLNDELKFTSYTVNLYDGIPNPSGNAGKFLKTNGSTNSWETVDALPSQTSNSGKYLKTDGTEASWETVEALPSQSSNSGKYLKTDGTTASWATVDALPSQSSNSGKYLTTDGTTATWAPLTSPSKAGGAINVNSTTATESYTFPSGTNGLSVGPITLADGVSVTVASGQRWVII